MTDRPGPLTASWRGTFRPLSASQKTALAEMDIPTVTVGPPLTDVTPR